MKSEKEKIEEMRKYLFDTSYETHIDIDIKSSPLGHEITLSESESGDNKTYRFNRLDEDKSEIKRLLFLYVSKWIATNEEWLTEDLEEMQAE